MELENKNTNLAKKVLPVSYPMITTYTQHAHLLSILSSYEQTFPWIFSNYIQLYINKDYRHNWGDFYFPFPYELRPSDTCKWIKSQKICRDIVYKKWESIVDFIIDYINSDNYVHLMVNSFNIPHYIQYQKQHRKHDILVYGYDISEKLLYVADFYNVDKYSFEKVSFADFNQAFLTYNLATNQDYLNEMIYLYKFNDKCDYKYNIKNIANSIKSYLSSNITEYWDIYNRDNREEIVFGAEVFDTLKNYLNNEIAKDEFKIDIRPFYMLYDHKKIMALRIKYITEQGYLKKHSNTDIINAFEEIESQALAVVNLLIKYTITKNNALIERIEHTLDEIKKNEYDALKTVLLELNYPEGVD